MSSESLADRLEEFKGGHPSRRNRTVVAPESLLLEAAAALRSMESLKKQVAYAAQYVPTAHDPDCKMAGEHLRTCPYHATHAAPTEQERDEMLCLICALPEAEHNLFDAFRHAFKGPAS